MKAGPPRTVHGMAMTRRGRVATCLMRARWRSYAARVGSTAPGALDRISRFREGIVQRILILLLAVAGPVQAADPGSATAPQATARGTRAESEPPEKLPPGVIQRGTLANSKLIADTALGVGGVAATLGIKPVEKASPYVTQLPRGAPGSRTWRERWVVSNGGKSAAIDILFAEDGAGGATWSIEASKPVLEQKHCVAAAREFVRLAQAGNVDRMIELTSPRTLRQSDRRQVSESYRTYVVPRFEDATVTWADTHAPVVDETGNHGWDVAGDAMGSESFSFFITVVKEDGRYVVVTLGRRDPDE